MSEKFRTIVAMPEEAAKKLRKFIEKKKPAKYIQERRKQKDDAGIKVSNPVFRDTAAVIGLGTMKWSAWLAAGGSQFLLTLARWLTLDNAFLRNMEKHYAEKEIALNNEGKAKKLDSFAKKYPNLYAHILWWLGLTAVSGAGYVAAEYGPDAVQTYKEWRADKQAEKQAQGTYKAFLNKMQPITPFLIADLIAKEGVHTDENGMHAPYRDSKGIPTIGFGSTVLKDGSRVTMNTPPITNDEAYELARWHLEEGETYFVLYCYDVAQNGVDIKTTNEALGMSSIVYNSYSKLIEAASDKNHKNRFTELRKLYEEYGYALPDSLIQKCFAEYPIQSATSFGEQWLGGADKAEVADKLGGFLAGGRGIYWRRWLEAGLLTGDITPQMLLNCPVNGMYEFFRVMGEEKSAFFTGDLDNRQVNRQTYAEFQKWLADPVNVKGQSLRGWKKVGDYLPADVLAFCQNGQCELDNKDFSKITKARESVEVKTYTLGYDELYQNAIAAYSNNDYATAAEQFENMLKNYPNNALLHNDLAATYNHLGRYEDAIEQAREILHRIGDKSQYAAAQYNAGFAYEQLGDYDKALANYKLSVANGNMSVKKDVERVKKLRSQKTIAFIDAAQKIDMSSRTSVSNQIIKDNENIA